MDISKSRIKNLIIGLASVFTIGYFGSKIKSLLSVHTALEGMSKTSVNVYSALIVSLVVIGAVYFIGNYIYQEFFGGNQTEKSMRTQNFVSAMTAGSMIFMYFLSLQIGLTFTSSMVTVGGNGTAFEIPAIVVAGINKSLGTNIDTLFIDGGLSTSTAIFAFSA